MFFSFFLDKSSTTAALARQYGAVCLSVDAVAADVLLNGTSPVSLTARQLFDSAAVEYAQKNGLQFKKTLGLAERDYKCT